MTKVEKQPIAILFAGQGAQKYGMGRDFYEKSAAAKEVFERARCLLGYDVAAVCFEGPAEKLNDTAICQPAIVTTSLAILAVVRERGVLKGREVASAAGLSLGEYSALTFAGALSADDAIRLVARRGHAMAQAAALKGGTMTSVIGLDREAVLAAVEEARAEGIVCAANFNCPGQIVISGEVAAVSRAAELCKARGARMVVPLAVSGAFHSPLMAPAAEMLREALATVHFRQPTVQVVSNVTARPVGSAEEIRGLLERQLTSPVLWEDSMRAFLGNGVRMFWEVGPGNVLAGLMRRIDREATVVSIDKVESLDLLTT